MRWAWHEKDGVRKGPIIRASDIKAAEEIEEERRGLMQRLFDWLERADHQGPVFGDRTCEVCGRKDGQSYMRWSGSRWMCPEHYAEELAALSNGVGAHHDHYCPICGAELELGGRCPNWEYE